MDRHIDADGWHNARDLGGLPTVAGGRIRDGALIRADEPDHLGDAGWSVLRERGVRTVIDLRDDDERDGTAIPADVEAVHVPLEQLAGPAFWAKHAGTDATPLYYRAYLTDAPHGVATLVSAVAGARPGGVLLHCSSGKDRTGLATLVLLALAGVPGAEIYEDYQLSYARLHELYLARGAGDQRAKVQVLARRHGTSMRQAVLDAAELDPQPYLRAAGVRDADVAAVRERLRDGAAEGE